MSPGVLASYGCTKPEGIVYSEHGLFAFISFSPAAEHQQPDVCSETAPCPQTAVTTGLGLQALYHWTFSKQVLLSSEDLHFCSHTSCLGISNDFAAQFLHSPQADQKEHPVKLCRIWVRSPGGVKAADLQKNIRRTNPTFFPCNNIL